MVLAALRAILGPSPMEHHVFNEWDWRRGNFNIEINFVFFYWPLNILSKGFMLSFTSCTNYVIVITWARVICLKFTHEHEGPSASVYISGPECSCVYFRQIKSAHVIINISHCPCRLIAYQKQHKFPWTYYIDNLKKFDYGLAARTMCIIWTDENGRILWRSRKVEISIVSWLLHCLRTVLHSLIKF